MIVSQSPGKLYIAGEYAVVNKGHSSIIIAVDQFIRVKIKKARERGSIQAFDNNPIPFERQDNRLVLDYRDNSLSYVINSINVVETLAKELNKTLSFYDLIVESELENKDGQKYGLGSSAAVTVSTIKVLCKLYDIKVSYLELFKLAAIVHMNIKSNGSCGDVAASVYGGWISFKTFDREWLETKIKTNSIKSIIKEEWPYLHIERLVPPKDLNLLIGWTKTPSSTTVLVDKVNHKVDSNHEYYQDFLDNSETCLSTMIQAFKDSNIDVILEQIAVNRSLLQSLGSKLNISIETPKLYELCEIAIKHGGQAKSSGAGGGDCGIVMIKDDVDTSSIILEWDKVGIRNLPLSVYDKENYND